nr:MAG: hypothetical protein EDM05_19220 [Leptolyngbya sp. IPPAS B-1204]
MICFSRLGNQLGKQQLALLATKLCCKGCQYSPIYSPIFGLAAWIDSWRLTARDAMFVAVRHSFRTNQGSY